jgi:hypothetical protein
MPAGLNGLLQLVLAMTAMVVASAPKHDRQVCKGRECAAVEMKNLSASAV